MKKRGFKLYYVLASLGVLIAAAYPIEMGVRVSGDMIRFGTVDKENYPKYIIPYTPICIALIVAVLLMPLFLKLFRRFASLGASAAAIGIFFAAEALFEKLVVVTSEERVVSLEDWQMYMCYIDPDSVKVTYRTQSAVDILLGEYDPSFKLHFYLISVVLIAAIVSCLYGFGRMAAHGEGNRPLLIVRSVATAMFLALCILACFTAFWRDGELAVSPLSAALMVSFFVLFGVVFGLFVSSHVRNRRAAVALGAITAGAMTFMMYVGEMILLNGNLYILGSHWVFRPLAAIVFAPADIAVILLSAALSALITHLTKSGDRATLNA